MTVSQLRDKMMEKVVPEKVMPQNIVAFLMDEDSDIPELDAFTFLNRLRALGIGSADFLYLLKGCNAPAQAVEKIQSNPAMNLNSLILTLEGAGLNSQDYTRMLYTARQLWERTLTMRIENVEAPEPDVKEYVPRPKYAESYPAQKSVEAVTVPEMPAPEADDIAEESAAAPPAEDYPYAEPAEAAPEEPDYSAESEPENFYTVDSILAEILGETAPAQSEEQPSEQESAAPTEEAAQILSEDSAEPENTDETDEQTHDTEQPEGEIYDIEQPEEAAEEESSDEPAVRITARVFTETSQFDKLRDEPNEPEELPAPENPEEQAAPAPESEKSGSRGALVAAAVGAAVVFAAAAVVGLMGFEPREPLPDVRFAESNAEIFAAIYNSYNKGVVGGSSVIEYVAPEASMFGTNLIAQRPDGLGTFSVGDTIFTCEPQAITLSDGMELLPPEGSFVLVFDTEDALYAVYSGDDSGFMRIGSSGSVYVTEQVGTLTDVLVSDGTISLGTAYVPAYSESFSIEQTECYMPTVGGEVIAAQEVVLSGENGCGYGLSAGYDLSDGSVKSARAVLCDPVFAKADGTLFGATSQGGGLLVMCGEEISTERTGVLSAWAAQGIIATAEDTAEGKYVYVRDSGAKALSALNNLVEDVTSLCFDESTLLIGGEEGVFLTADCSQPDVPVPQTPQPVRGIARDGVLLTAETVDAGLRLTLYEVAESGEAAVLYSYTKILKPSERESLVLGGTNTFFVSRERAGAAYSYFDGVSVVSELALLGPEQTLFTLYDDPTGIIAVTESDGKICAVHNGIAEPVV